MNTSDALLADIDQLLAQKDYELSPIGAAILVACARGIAMQSHAFARTFGLAHALIIRECATLCDELDLIKVNERNTRTQSLNYSLTEHGRKFVESACIQTQNDVLGEKSHPPIKQVEAIGCKDGQDSGTSRHHIANEVPIAMVFNGSSMAVMMATPLDLEDFAYGFALSEGFITSQDDVERFELQQHPSGIEARFWLTDTPTERLDARRRQMAGPIGCGLCGLESIEQAMRDVPKLRNSNLRISRKSVFEAMQALSSHQALHDQTGAVHAAGFYQEQNGMVLAREDVGRHNALDKVIGALHLRQIDPIKTDPSKIDPSKIDPSEGAIVITSRLSMDLVQKAAMAGVPIIIAASAPTATAIELAWQTGVTLVAQARNKRFEIFTHSFRIDDTNPTSSHQT